MHDRRNSGSIAVNGVASTCGGTTRNGKFGRRFICDSTRLRLVSGCTSIASRLRASLRRYLKRNSNGLLPNISPSTLGTCNSAVRRTHTSLFKLCCITSPGLIRLKLAPDTSTCGTRCCACLVGNLVARLMHVRPNGGMRRTRVHGHRLVTH